MTHFAAALLGALVALAASLVVWLAHRYVSRYVSRRRASERPAPVPEVPRAVEMQDHIERVDREAFRALRASGADRAGPTDVQFFLRFPSQHAAESAAAQVASLPLEASQLGVQVDRLPLGAG